MFRFITLLCLAVACLGHPLEIPDGKIVGGTGVNIEQYKYQISLQINGGHSCGGSIISTTWVLTAAHCTTGNVNSMTIRAGSSIRGSGGTVHQVAQKISHGSYNSGTTDYDFSLLRVSTPFNFGSTIGAIALPSQDESVATGANCAVSGWGTLSEGGSLPSQLQAVTVPVVSQASCQGSYGTSAITARMICAGLDQGGKDSCQGDSGGPMVTGNKLVGVVSWGRGCARPGYPGVYSRVANQRNWIAQNSGV